MEIRPATADDAAGLCAVLNPLIEAGGTTALRTPYSPERMTREFIAPPSLVACTVAVEEGVVLGFQMLDWAHPTWTAKLGVPADWAVIATFVRQGLAQRGIGTLLFAASEKAARDAGVVTIDATIRRENAGGLAYYDRMGFGDYRATAEAISKRYDL